MNDEDFYQAVCNGDLPAASFNHRGHLRLAWIVLVKRPDLPAEATLKNLIRNFATRLGAAEKYHATITVALTKIMAQRLAAAGNCGEFESFVAKNQDLLDDAFCLLLRHYSEARLGSDLAKREFVEPDKQPFATKNDSFGV